MSTEALLALHELERAHSRLVADGEDARARVEVLQSRLEALEARRAEGGVEAGASGAAAAAAAASAASARAEAAAREKVSQLEAALAAAEARARAAEADAARVTERFVALEERAGAAEAAAAAAAMQAAGEAAVAQQLARERLLGAEPVLGARLLEDDELEGHGIEVDVVRPGGAADMAGMQPGDIIVAVEGMATVSHPAFNVVLENAFPGEVNTFTLLRGGRQLEVEVRYHASGIGYDELMALREAAGAAWVTEMDESAFHVRDAHVVTVKR
ncbi:uncharacterized protein AMSG_02571 [Thecamonas trahens ATCC 50062]|uniref:PDZ domain-containing protein n=1 Tax=Thecamonas trahens ATCC 50062 TaxID=461836 RepID=A0A0L0D644_THETB|nr:hypothetical protein AMSG_02571 [Thecamonas trahens ATCC 50062]KNC47546.1 hypothetical protein AMSG_02571 [Thecamonas trahens ATCC 50062]|eukprot:XP_013759478.1 hypothetical protein AMSG_02571 [Thecamonas trahens ATCC 50062]